ncbi:neutral and basic amino acid transport protein rBAT [Sinocyclocheilus grahami]|uniref:neutral and basic amino acid transport protein rBAT n=1 Tax=Sinocyclocheilus grahami TaxID=75366 RepID=UPI0007ACEE61|nr:PREDICTED: neutral and basic amino acid transport protein rBAT [Sinocyclocheilus grahami]
MPLFNRTPAVGSHKCCSLGLNEARKMSSTKITNIDAVELQEGIQNAAFHEDDDTSDASSFREQLATSMSVTRPEENEYTQIKPYAGMPKEVLMLYSSKACYRIPREIIFWLIVACTLALIAMTVTIVALSPRCMSWWQLSPVYQVYPRSFKDSNADGVGDLKGIEEKLSHFEYLNIKAVWISPFYKSPMRDFGYDVEDFRQIDPIFGTMEDFDDLLASMHDKGLKLIMDYIPNHTSDKHIWFQLSQNGTEPYKDYYIWVNCTRDKPPNNWVSVFGNSTWEYDEVRQQCYFHQFLKEQPDLNYRNPRVIEEMTSTVDTEFELYHDYTFTQQGLHEILTNWRIELDDYSREPGRYRFMVIECYDYEEIDKTMRYYGTSYVNESDFPFNFYLLNSRDPQRTPMQWDDKLNAGFSDSENGTWLDIAPDYSTVNVELQQADTHSTISQYRALSLLRGAELALSRGWFCFVWSDVNVFAYLRELDGLNKAFLVVLNFGKDTTTDLSSVTELPDTLTVHLSTVPISQKTFSKSRIPTSQGQGLLLEYSTNQRFHPNHASECYVSEKACYLPALDILYKC